MSKLTTTRKRNRQSNFSPSEISLIADEVKARHSVLFGPFSSTVTNTAKIREWDEIATKLNACSAVQRSGPQIRKKWNDYKSQVKKKAIDVRRESCKTGGGPAPVGLSDLEHKVVSMIPNCQIESIPGGLESEVDEICITLNNRDAPVCPFVEVDEEFESGLTKDSLPVASNGLLLSTTSLSEHAIAPLSSQPAPDLEQAASELHTDRPHKTVNASEINSRTQVTHKSRKSDREAQPGVTAILGIEKEKAEILKDLLQVQKQILAVSQKRLQVESDRLALEREKFEFKKSLMSLPEYQTASPVIKFLHEL